MPIYRSEADVKKEVKKILDAHRWFWWMPPGSAFGKPNVDFNALRQGIFLAIETKFRDNTPTPLQKKFLKCSHEEEGLGFWFNEDGVEHFRTFMQAFDRAMQDSKKEDANTMRDMTIQLTKGLIKK